MMERRRFLESSLAIASSGAVCCDESSPAAEADRLERKIGLVTASLSLHFSSKPSRGKITLLDLPAFLKNELGIDVIDFNTANFPSFDPVYLEQLRRKIAENGCIATNLKMNQKVNMTSPDPGVRRNAMQVYKNSIDAAAELGLRWVRPLPRSEKPDPQLQSEAFDELIDYAGERDITVLIENFGWMMSDESSLLNLAVRIGRDRVQISLDTGNWDTNEIRYPALKNTFPHTVTCDFKAKKITDDFQHPQYNLKRCFDIGWEAGFRGPWALEHGNPDFSKAKQELLWMKENLERWIAEREK